jgi:hypothetical protein
LIRRRGEQRLPLVLFITAVVLYLATPKTLSGIYLVSVRLPVFAAALSLMLVDWRDFPRWGRGFALAVSLVALAQAAIFHHQFAGAMEGLQAMVDGPPPGRHAYFSVAGPGVLGSRNIYAEHLGQWVTATRGGTGQNFFADAEHHPVRFHPGHELSADALHATAAELAFYDTVFVYGAGPLPQALQGWRQVQRSGGWRRLRRRDSR